MARDPYIGTWWRQRLHQTRAEGVGGVLRGVGLPLLSVVMLTPLVRQVFLGFLGLPPLFWPDGVSGVALRAGLVVTGWLSLDVYTALLRNEDRTVLALLPVDTARVVRAELVQVAVSRWWLLVGAAIVLAPIAASGAPALWAGAVIVLCGAFAMGLTLSAAVFLLAVAVAEDPRWAGLLDLARGNNPRVQAAFLYAPGLVLLAGGGLTYRASAALVEAMQGSLVAMAWLAAPFAVAVLAAVPIPRLARGQWFRGSAVVSEIDARYAVLADPKEALRVYLDWVARFLPGAVARYALDDLRHGWRQRRSLVTGGWLIGTLALAAGWTSADEGPGRVVVVVVLGAFLVAANGVLMVRDEPGFLVHWLPPRGPAGALARAIVLLLWIAPVGLGGAVATAVFRGAGNAFGVLGLAVGAGAVAAITSVACGQLGPRGMAAYAPVGTVLAVGIAAWMGGA